ncbi:A-kinase anchor protein 13-like isoform X2 [Embiotoca jacksoni]|uniref:A-kinase anchor protein 13-like isoform X2 n=1 Tax=Embiotoca jacksoni TaxID=100190 RepID=UPI003704D087
MKLNPQQAPLYGECVLTVQLDDDDVRCAEEEEEEEDMEFYLVFSGSTQRHVSSTLRVSHVTLQAVCPAHNVCEQVLVTLCLARPGGPVDTHSQETFCFVQDLALDMAHFLLDSTTPQEALLLDDEQIPLKECERLDERLALALKHLRLPPHWTAPAPPSADGSSLRDSHPGVSECQQLSGLLHLAASHGLKTVASLLLQQPGAKEALRRTNTRGQTPACAAKTRGHQQLVELLTQYETSSGVQAEAEQKFGFNPGGGDFRHHASLGTYSLTSPVLLQRDGGTDSGSKGGCCLQEEVDALRRRMRRHRETKETSDFVPAHVSIDQQLLSAACGPQYRLGQDAGLAVVTTDNCSTTTEEQGSWPWQGEDSAAVTHTSSAGGRLCQSQEVVREQRAAPAANSPSVWSKKNKRRITKTTRPTKETHGNTSSTPEAGRGTAHDRKTTGSVSSEDGATTSVIGERGDAENECSPETHRTPLPIKPASGSGGNGKHTDREAVTVLTTPVVEKQEEEKWEVELLMCERVPKTGRDPQTEQEDSAAENTEIMGQDQSQNPQESQSDPDEPSQPKSTDKSPPPARRTSSKSPDADRKHRRALLRRDGGRMGSSAPGAESVAKTIWYQDENLDQSSNEDSNKKEGNCQSFWYDGDTAEEGKQEQLQQGTSEQRAAGLTSSQLFQQGPSSPQAAAALSQPHAAGAPPALSHGSDAQRREVHRSQQEEEVRSDWKKGGVEGGGQGVSNRETTSSRTSSVGEAGEQKPGSDEKGATVSKKKRRKRGKRGGAEAKLSSGSSLESPSQTEIQREPVTNLSAQSRTESAAGDKREEADMHLPCPAEVRTEDAHGPNADRTNSDCVFSTPELGPMDHMRADVTEDSQIPETKDLTEDDTIDSHGLDDFNPDSTVEVSEMDIRKVDGEESSTVQPTAADVLKPFDLESKGPDGPVALAGKTVASVDPTDLVKSDCLKKLPVQHSDSTDLTEDLFRVDFPEQNSQQSVDVMSVDPTEAFGLPFEDGADVSELQIREGSAETTAGEYLEHCPPSETPRDRQRREEKRLELWVGEEEVGKKRSWERKSDENDSRMAHGDELCSVERGKPEEDEDFPSSDGKKEQSCNKDLVATAVAVVAVAIASAVASLELSQQGAGRQSGEEECAGTEVAKDTGVANETETQPSPLSQTEPTNQSSSRERARVEMSEESVRTEAAAPGSPRRDNKEVQTETAQNTFGACSLNVCRKPALEENEATPARDDRGGRTHTDILPREESHRPRPVVVPGRDPEASDEFFPGSASQDDAMPGHRREPRDRAVCQREGDGQRSGSHFQKSEVCDGIGAQTGGTAPEDSESRERDLTSDRPAREQDGPPQQLRTPREEDIPAPPTSLGSALPVTHDDSDDAADPVPEKLTAPVNVETGEVPSDQSSANVKLVTNPREGSECVAVDDVDGVIEGQRTADGREETERKKMKREAGTEDTSQTEEAEPFPAEEEKETRDSDSTHTLQIQRERNVFYPVQAAAELSAVTPCTDVLPDGGDCVSMCLLHTAAKDDLTVGAERDDGVFKKPECPPPCVGQRDRQLHVSRSSTDGALMQGAFHPSEGALSAGTADTVAPPSSRLSWQSETEDRGGGETEGAGDEEENKDQLLKSPVSSAMLRASIRSLSPFRRHSWEPGRSSTAAQSDGTQRSSPKSLSGEVKRAKPPLHRRSMSWCPSNLPRPDQAHMDSRSFSLEGLETERPAVQTQSSSRSDPEGQDAGRSSYPDSQERGSLVSLTEEEQEGDSSSMDSQTSHQVVSVTSSCSTMFHHPTLTKSISMVTISQRDVDGGSSFTCNSGSLGYSISEEEPGPLRTDTEGKGGPKISRTFSYLRSKMSKKGKEKEKERKAESKRESKEREKKSASGHLFIPISPPASTACHHCTKLLHNKETFLCNNCGVHVHKSCTESLSVCAKSKTKQALVPEAGPGSAVNMRSKSTSSASSLPLASLSSSRERWSTATTPDDQIPVMFPRRHPSIFNSHSNLAKSISTSNIAGLDDVPLKGLKFLSQSTDSLHQGSKVNASTESLTDEGTEMIDSQLMGEFECDIRDLEADSWSGMVDKKFLKMLKKDEIKRQDVIYELYQTEVHHLRTLKIMSEVYYKSLQKELQLDTQTLDKIFPVLDELVEMHTHFLTLLLERKRASSAMGQNSSSLYICRIGGMLVNQFSGCSSDRMKKVYGKFCSRHNEAVSLYKDLHAKDKRFQAVIKRIMSSSIVRRLSIPECILLVTQRITKYPVLIQRILQHTKDTDEDHSCVSEALRCVKELILAVDCKVNEQEKKQRLREVYSRTDSKSIMRMKSGQMFAKEDLIRGRKLLHDGALQLKNSAGRLKDVHAMLLSDVLVFLQEKDQKYVFASLDQRSTVVSLHSLIVREVANEERGLFLITAGIAKPEMVEVLASSKEERNTWRAIVLEAMHCIEKDEDEGVPSETEEDRRQQENRAKEIRELLRRKDEQIVSLLEEKVHIFRELGDCGPTTDDTNPPVRERMLFKATPDDVTKGEPIMTDALREVEALHALVSSGVGGAGCSAAGGLTGGGVGPVCLPRRAETFGGFDSHQMNSSKNGEKEEGDESLDLRRTESDSVLKKGATASLQMMLKRNTEQVQYSVTHLHGLLVSLQAVVVQQDSFIEDQRQALNERLATNSSRHSSSSSLSSSSSSRPSSIIEQEKHRSLERQRQEAASLQKQQAAHQDEKRRREREWEFKEKELAERDERLREEEEETRRRRQELMEETEMMHRRKEEYQRELERLREAQRRLERDKEALRRDTERLDARRDQSEQLRMLQRTPSTTSEDSLRFHSSGSLEEAAEQQKEVELSSSAPAKESFLRIGSKRMGKNFNPFFSSSSSSKLQGAEKESQLPTKLLQLAKPKEKKDKKKKGKGGEKTQTENKCTVMLDPQNEGDIFFC